MTAGAPLTVEQRTGWGLVRLYDKENGSPVLVDEIEASRVGLRIWGI